jgi:hypothetical protein
MNGTVTNMYRKLTNPGPHSKSSPCWTLSKKHFSNLSNVHLRLASPAKRK